MALLLILAVKDNFKGLGIGSKLLRALELTFPEAEQVELFTGINHKANLNMYERRGYTWLNEALLGKNGCFLSKMLNVTHKKINLDK